MQENVMECGLGAHSLHGCTLYLNTLLQILCQIEQQFFCIYMFLASLAPQLPKVVMWRHAAHANLHQSVAKKKLSRFAIPVELLIW